MERLMYLWDELDDWLGVGRHILRGTAQEAAALSEAASATWERAGAALRSCWHSAAAGLLGFAAYAATWRPGPEV